MADPSSSDDQQEQDWKLQLAQKTFLYKTQRLSDKEKGKLQQEILTSIFDHGAAPFYEQTCEELGWTIDSRKLEELRAGNAAKVAELDGRIEDAEKNLGDIEVRDACLAKAEFLCSIGDRAAARAAYAVTESKTAGTGQKMDLLFAQLRLDLARGDWRAVKGDLKRAGELCAEGGDWEHKNRLKVYQAVFALATRDLVGAARQLLDSVATFTSSEVLSYERCIFYIVVASLVTLPRTELKAKVVDSPEILAVLGTRPPLAPFLNALYACDYRTFFQAFAAITDEVRADRYLHPHFRYYVREVRGVAYAQFLESYKSVTLESMAAAFGVTPAFMDAELVDFIVAGRLSAKIDKVAGIIETNRPDAKNAQYQATIKQGDLLLNRLQKLSKVIDIE